MKSSGLSLAGTYLNLQITREGREQGGIEKYAEEERKEVNSGISQWGEKDHINEVKKGERKSETI